MVGLPFSFIEGEKYSTGARGEQIQNEEGRKEKEEKKKGRAGRRRARLLSQHPGTSKGQIPESHRFLDTGDELAG